MPPHLKFTEDEKTKMDEYLATKASFEEKRRILQQQLEEVDLKIIETQADYGAIYNKRNPIFRLPVEVTCLIFTYAQLPRVIEKNDACEEEEEEVELLIEVIVSHVCRQWRSISLGLSKLWTCFHFEAGPIIAVPLERFDAYLERSAALPLRIWFDFKGDVNDSDNVKLVEKAVEHANRWQHFTLYSSDGSVMGPFRQLQDQSAPMLEYLTLVPHVELNDEELDDLVDEDFLKVMTSMDPQIFRAGAPKLTYLMTDGYSMRYALPPLSNITILRIEKQQIDSIQVFERLPFLELLSLSSLTQLSLSGDLIEPFGRPRSIHMPNLKRFRVSEFDTIWDLLPSLRAPKLDTLIIHICTFASGYLAGTSPASPDRGYSFPSLRKIYVIDSNVEFSVVPTFTQLTSQATDVLISHESLLSSLMQRIVNGGYAGVVWPQLKKLSCNIAGVNEIDTYVAFAESRPKNSFEFRLHPMIFDQWDEGLEELKEVSIVVLDEEWELDESFWPQDNGLGPNYDFGKDDYFAISVHI